MGKPVVAILSGAFNSKTSMIKVVIPDSVTSVAENAFKQCSKLESCHVMGKNVEFPGSVSPWYGLTKVVVYVYENSTTHTNIQAIKGQIRYTVETMPNA